MTKVIVNLTVTEDENTDRLYATANGGDAVLNFNDPASNWYRTFSVKDGERVDITSIFADMESPDAGAPSGDAPEEVAT